MKYCVYFLIDPMTDNVFYVGKGKIENKRKFHHLWEFKEWDKLGRFKDMRPGWNLHKLRTIAKIVDAGLEVGIEVVFETSENEEALLQEISCIAAFGRENLTNLTDGGEGTSGLECSEKTRKKIGSANKGKIRTPDCIERISKSLTGRKKSKEWSSKIRESLIGNRNALGFKHSEDAKRRISASKTGKKRAPFSEEHKKKISIAKRQRDLLKKEVS